MIHKNYLQKFQKVFLGADQRMLDVFETILYRFFIDFQGIGQDPVKIEKKQFHISPLRKADMEGCNGFLRIPFSVRIAVISRAGVMSKAGL